MGVQTPVLGWFSSIFGFGCFYRIEALMHTIAPNMVVRSPIRTASAPASGAVRVNATGRGSMKNPVFVTENPKTLWSKNGVMKKPPI